MIRALLCIFVVLFAFQTPLAEEQTSSPAPDIVMELNNLDPSWISNYETKTGDQKVEFLNLIKDQLHVELSSLPDLDVENAKRINQLIKGLSNFTKKVLPVYELPQIQTTYSLNDLLVLLGKKNRASDEVVLVLEDIKQLKAVITEIKQQIPENLVSYKKLPEQSVERLTLAVHILRLQLELLFSRERSLALSLRQSVASKSVEDITKQLKTAVSLLQFSKKDLNERLEKLKWLVPKLETAQKKLSSLEQKKLGVDNELVPMKFRIQKLVLQADILAIHLQRVALNLEVEIEEGLDSKNIIMPSLAGDEWTDYQGQPQELDNKLKSFFHVLVIKEQEMSSAERKYAWVELQKSRAIIDAIFKRSKDIEFLKYTHNTVAQTQVNWRPRLLGSINTLFADAKDLSEGIWDYPLFDINQQPLTLLDIAWYVFIIVFAILLSSLLRKMLNRIAEKQKSVSESAMYNIGRIFHYIIILVSILIGFSVLGIDISKLALVAGALSVGIGFGMQSIFNNFFSGLILLFERPLNVGDLVMLESGVRGRIKSINVRSTQLTTWDNIDVLVPNSELVSGRVTNYTFDSDLRRIHVPFGVAYGTDKNLVKSAVIEAALKVSFTVNTEDDQPEVWLVEMGESSLNFELVVWIRGNLLSRRDSASATYLWQIDDILREYNIEVPFPQRDVHVRTNDIQVKNSQAKIE